jgi:prepilin-type N-terminal cleavage/methylation domain-containing protein
MKRNAFTMVEIVIVIVILGIIAGIGANIIAKMYMNYMQARTINYLQTQSSITLEQIAKRLQYRIKDSTIARRVSDNDVRRLSDSQVTDDYSIIQWIGYSNEALLTQGNPGWSGFIDLDNELVTNRTPKTLSTPGSDLSYAANVMKELSYGEVDLTDSTKPAALIFRVPGGNNPNEGYGWDGSDGDIHYILKVYRNSDDVLNINSTLGPDADADNLTIYEQYYLAHSAYAIVPDTAGGDVTNFKLELHYNYEPWNGNKYDDATTKKALLATNVNLFRIRQTGNTIRLKLCLHDNNRSGFGNYIAACKEEVVL